MSKRLTDKEKAEIITDFIAGGGLCLAQYVLFWAGPFTPAVPLQIGFVLLLKKIFTKKNKRV